MCERYELKATAGELIRHFPGLHLGQRAMPQAAEIVPGTPLLILTRSDKIPIARRARWGLVGSFLGHEPSNPPAVLEGEGLLTTPFYGKILRRQRCLVPATAFLARDAGRRQLRICHPRGKLLLLGGIFDQHPQAGTTCAILTVGGEPATAGAPSRRPLLLDAAACHAWLAEDEESACDAIAALLQSPPSPPLKIETLRAVEISPQLSFAFA